MIDKSEKLKKLGKDLKSKVTKGEILIGFDGFVDDIIAVIDKRESVTSYKRIDSISKYAERIKRLSGVSGSIELDTLQQKLGGNAPIMGNSLIRQGFPVNAIVTIGTKNAIHPVFKEFASQCKFVAPIANPGNTLAFEFDDGKIMMNQLGSFGEVNWENLKKILGEENLKNLLRKCSLGAFVNWAMLPFMSSVYAGLADMLDDIKVRLKIFIDLADIMRRTSNDIVDMLAILTKLGKNNDLILGLNFSEAEQISEHLGLPIVEKKSEEYAKLIRNKLNITAIVIHETKRAVISTKTEIYAVDGPYTEKPKLTTGAGDNFNAGFCSGWQQGLTWEQCLFTGVYTSGFYVRNAYSPSSEELIKFIEENV
jgi:ATP-dependent protease HslVU (ClpYQ) peptidase subunit